MKLPWIAFSLVVFAASTAAAEEPGLEVATRGPTVQAEVGMSRAGYRLMADLGGETAGLRTIGSHWLFAWDLLGAARLGVLANTEPYLFLFGARLSALAEPSYRFLTDTLSPVLSARLQGDGSFLWPVATPGRDLMTLNDMDGVGGVVGRGRGRLGAGLSYLEGGRSLLLTGFGEETMATHGQNKSGEAFTGGGVAARFDWSWGLSATLEVGGATTIAAHDDALDRTASTTRLSAAGGARKIFDSGVWLGLESSIQRDTEHVRYEATGTDFDVAPPADFRLGLALGVSLWGAR